MLRAIGGVVAGIIVGLIVQGLLGLAVNLIHPIQADPFNRGQVADAFLNRPPLIAVLSGLTYFAGALAAAWVARLVSFSKAAGWTAAGIVALLALLVAIAYPEPAWAQYGAFVLALFGGLFGVHLPVRERAAPAAESADDAAL